MNFNVGNKGGSFTGGGFSTGGAFNTAPKQAVSLFLFSSALFSYTLPRTNHHPYPPSLSFSFNTRASAEAVHHHSVSVPKQVHRILLLRFLLLLQIIPLPDLLRPNLHRLVVPNLLVSLVINLLVRLAGLVGLAQDKLLLVSAPHKLDPFSRMLLEVCQII